MVKKHTHFWKDVKDLMVSCILKTGSHEFIDFAAVVLTMTVIYIMIIKLTTWSRVLLKLVASQSTPSYFEIHFNCILPPIPESFLLVSPIKTMYTLSFPPWVPQVSSITSFVTCQPEQYLVSSTNHEASHQTFLSGMLLGPLYPCQLTVFKHPILHLL